MNQQVNEDQAIRALVSTYAEAWNRGDADGFASVFAPDADFTSIRLDRAHSRAEIASGHAAIFATIYKGTRLQADVERIRYVRPDVAIVDIDARLSDATGMSIPGQAHALCVAARDSARWQIIAFQNMVPVGAPPA
jgi:uncharacterized protein (TIGR02246 family)